MELLEFECSRGLKNLKASPNLYCENKYGFLCSQNHGWISSEKLTWSWKFIENCRFLKAGLFQSVSDQSPASRPAVITAQSGEWPSCALQHEVVDVYGVGRVFKIHWALSHQLGTVTGFVNEETRTPWCTFLGRREKSKETRRSYCTPGEPARSLGQHC